MKPSRTDWAAATRTSRYTCASATGTGSRCASRDLIVDRYADIVPLQENTRGRSAGVFRSLGKAFGLSSATTDLLLRQNREDPENSSYTPPTLPLPDDSTSYSPSPGLSCPHALYAPTSPLAPLNRPLYIATDAPSPRTADSLALFRNTFPCLFFFDDFRAVGPLSGVPVKPVERLAAFVGDRTGEPLERFLAPFVEAEVVAKSKVALGSEFCLTFSSEERGVDPHFSQRPDPPSRASQLGHCLMRITKRVFDVNECDLSEVDKFLCC